jgi:hypothetical protein
MVMPTYTDTEAVGEYLLLSDAGLELPDDPDLADALIERAELDIDRFLLAATLERDEDTGRKIDPETLTAVQQAALARATAAQVEYRLAVEEAEFVGDDTVTRSGEISFGPIPRPGPKAVEELSAHGFAWRSGTVAPDPEPEEVEA